MAKRILLTEPHIYRPGGPRDSGTDTCRDCHQSLSTSWLHTDQALKLMIRVQKAEAKADRLAEQVRRVEALCERWENALAIDLAYGRALRAALGGTEETTTDPPDPVPVSRALLTDILNVLSNKNADARPAWDQITLILYGTAIGS